MQHFAPFSFFSFFEGDCCSDMLKQQRHTTYSVGHSSGLRARANPDDNNEKNSGPYYDQVHRLQSILDEVPSLSNDAFKRPSILAMFLLQLQVATISAIEALSSLSRPLERTFLVGTLAHCAHQAIRGFLLIALVLAENVSQALGVEQEISGLRCNGHHNHHPPQEPATEHNSNSSYQIESTSGSSSVTDGGPQTPELPPRPEPLAHIPEQQQTSEEEAKEKDIEKKQEKKQEKEQTQQKQQPQEEDSKTMRARCTSTPVFEPIETTKMRTRSLSNNMSVLFPRSSSPKLSSSSTAAATSSSSSSTPPRSPVLSSFPQQTRPLSLRRVMGQRDLIHGNRSNPRGRSTPVLTASSSTQTTAAEPMYVIRRGLHRSASTTFGAVGNQRV